MTESTAAVCYPKSPPGGEVCLPEDNVSYPDRTDLPPGAPVDSTSSQSIDNGTECLLPDPTPPDDDYQDTPPPQAPKPKEDNSLLGFLGREVKSYFPSDDKKKAAEEQVKLGDQHYKEDRYEEAYRAYKKAVQLNPRYRFYISVRTRKGIALSKYRARVKAEAKLPKADLEAAKHYEGTGDFSMVVQDYEAAIRDYSASLELNPYNDAVKYQLRKAYQEKGKAEFYARAHKHEGLASKAKKPSERLAHYENALNAYQLVGDVQNAKKILALMLKEYRELKNETGVTQVKAELAFIDGRLEEALKGFLTLEAALKLLDKGEREGALAEVNLKIVAIHQAMAAKTEHKKDYRTAIDHPKIVIYPALMADKAEHKDYRTAIDHLKAALKRKPSKELMEHLIGLLIIFKRQKQQAIGEVEHLIDLERTPTYSSHQSQYPQWAPLKFEWEKDEKELLAEREVLTRQVKAIDEDFQWVLRTGMGTPQATDWVAQINEAKIIANFHMEAGDPEKATKAYESLLPKFDQAIRSARDAKTKTALILDRANIRHRLASIYLQVSKGKKADDSAEDDSAKSELLKKAQQHLDQSLVELNQFKPRKQQAAQGKEFFIVQNLFLKSEVLSANMKERKDVEAVLAMLEQLKRREYDMNQQFKPLVKSSMTDALYRQVRLRLAQLYYGHWDARTRKLGDSLTHELLVDRHADENIKSQALLAQGMNRLKKKGRSARRNTHTPPSPNKIPWQ